MSVTFPFKQEPSPIFGKVKRPIAKVEFYNEKLKFWIPVTMIVDSGADYTLLPKNYIDFLNINIKKETKTVKTQGVSGQTEVFLLKHRVSARINNMQRSIVLGIIDNFYTPPLLGRYTFLETFKVVLENFKTTFS